MELLYTWINYSDRGVIKQQGINFSPEFEFVFEKINDKWVLYEDNNWKKKISIFKNNTIENVSVIVGKNGSGKTNLLDYLSGLNCSIPARGAFDERYAKLIERDLRDSLCVIIIRDRDIVTIYHDFADGIVNNTNYYVEDMSDNEKYGEYVRKQIGFLDIFKIYITNSSFGMSEKTGISSHGKLNEISLTPAGISTIASAFYRKILNLDQVMYRPTINREWRVIVRDWRRGTAYFQQICDIVYFNKLHAEEKMKTYMGKIATRISITCALASNILIDKFPQFEDDNPQIEEEQKELYKYYMSMKKFITEIDLDVNIIIRNLVINLLLELCMEKNVLFPQNVKKVEGALEWVMSESVSCSNFDYYCIAVDEIKKMQEIVEIGEEYQNVVPEDDLAYNRSIIFDYERKQDSYIKFIKFITSCFEKQKSMVLRYLVMEPLGMSSGERALLNFFSWLNLLPQYHNIDPSIPKELRNTILLLIDEVDLYLHPEWQKSFIAVVIDEIEKQFSGYKVQLIFATHSPLCLSDIPKENIVYLDKKEGKTFVDKREHHDQTFGKDLYSLLNNAFFLENATMGDYAKKYVDSIISEILEPNRDYKKLTSKKYFEVYEQIQYIGNDVLRKKLTDMLNRCIDENEHRRQILLRHREQLDKELAELENR